MRFPDKLDIANLPTRIEKLDRLSESLGKNIFIKRDDMTGLEYSGNKIRKLEYCIKEAMNQGCDMLITCGGVQSNHARATAAVAARLGMNSCLVLRKTDHDKDAYDGNYYLDKLLGAKVKFITEEEYVDRHAIMDDLKKELSIQGFKPYVIPEGASNGIGTFGYINAIQEIIDSEESMGIKFDAVVVTVGSGGTYAGLYLGNELFRREGTIYGINICADKDYFEKRVKNIIDESLKYIDKYEDVTYSNIEIIDGYAGRGYALNKDDEIEFIQGFARLEGIILDPVYTGKALGGLVSEIKNGRFDEHNNILFVHTGGLFGAFPKRELFDFDK